MIPRRHRHIQHIADAGFELLELRGAQEFVELRMIGELWLYVAPDAEEILEEQVILVPEVHVDVSDLTFLDAIGVAVLERVVQLAEDSGCELSFVGPVNCQVGRMLKLSGAEQLMSHIVRERATG